MSALVVVHRRAGQDHITHTVRNDDGISIECSLDDFMRHMTEAMTAGSYFSTRKGFIADMHNACEESIRLLKESSVHNPPKEPLS